MRFLRSVIADSRSRKPRHAPAGRPSVLAGQMTDGLDGVASGAKERSQGEGDHTSSFNTSAHVRESVRASNEFAVGDSRTTLPGGDPVSENMHDTTSRIEPGRPESVKRDQPAANVGEERNNFPDSGDSTDHASVSAPESAVTEKANTSAHSVTVIGPDGGITSQNHDRDVLPALAERQSARRRVAAQDEPPVELPVGPTDSRERVPFDDDAGFAPRMAGRVWPGSADDSSSPRGGNQSTQGKRAEAVSDTQRRSAVSIEDSNALAYHADASPTPAYSAIEKSAKGRSNNAAEANESVSGLADGERASRSSTDDRQPVETRRLASRDGILRRVMPAAKSDTRSVGADLRPAMAADSHRFSDAQPAAVSRSAQPNVSPSAGSRSTNPVSPSANIASPAGPSANSQLLRSVPARPWPIDLMPSHGDSSRSRTPLRFPEKKPEPPRVQIGQIDVIVETAAQPARKSAPASAPGDLASRHYLRRL